MHAETAFIRVNVCSSVQGIWANYGKRSCSRKVGCCFLQWLNGLNCGNASGFISYLQNEIMWILP